MAGCASADLSGWLEVGMERCPDRSNSSWGLGPSIAGDYEERALLRVLPLTLFDRQTLHLDIVRDDAALMLQRFSRAPKPALERIEEVLRQVVDVVKRKLALI